MQVVHISYCDDGEGAAIAANRLCEALLEAGVDSKLLVKRKVGGKQFVIKVANGLISNAVSWIKTGIDMLLSKSVCKDQSIYFSVPLISSFKISELINKADIIHLHWISRGYLNLFDLYKLTKIKQPVFITMHDNWYFTGGCHMVGECQGFISGCKECPITRVKLITRLVAFAKEKILKRAQNFHFLAISEQMSRLAKSSYILKNIETIQLPNCVNTEIFRPQSKRLSRSVFNIPNEKKVVLFLVSNDPRKGMAYVTALINDRLFSCSDYLFVGYGSEVCPDEIKDKANVKIVGRLKDSHSLALIYNAADVLLAPSIEEPFGLTHIEAMACGTPTIGFDGTGTASIINHKTTGYLAKYRSEIDLKEGLIYTLSNLSILSVASRELALKRYSYSIVSNSVLAAYSMVACPND